MEKVLAENVKRLCKEQKKQLKDLASEMGVDPASLNRAMYGNARLDTIEKIATALGVSIKSMFDPIDDDTIEGYIKIKGKRGWKSGQIHGIIKCKTLIWRVGLTLNWFKSLIIGFFSGIADILPVSAQAHKAVLLTLFGVDQEPPLLRIFIHIAVFCALYYSCQQQIMQMIRQKQLARIPKQRRKRPVDLRICWMFVC